MLLLTIFEVFSLITATFTILYTTASSSCEPIKIPLCQRHLPYNMTMFPNALEQLSQRHAQLKIDLFSAIVAINCSSEAGFFLCSYYLPICAPTFKTQPIRPCRSVCTKVMTECMPTIRRYKAKWPEDVNCNELPSYNNNVCVSPQSFIKSEGLASSCQCSRTRLNFQLYQKNGYRFVLKVRIHSSEMNGSERILRGRVLRILRKGLIDLKKGDTIQLYSNTTCSCPRVRRFNTDYLVAGHEDTKQRKVYLWPGSGVVETWERTWVSRFRKWERRLAATKALELKPLRRGKKKRRKGGVSFADPDP
ncbi:PREDICTED: secreted frizzled-related protein 3-like [Acropora digitifera]|uniref:secreted frizzled-related protein 3-like n=1 Tax=Acropora digitifera TaxID=70779 RepID=UPI00077AF2A5|nr:PREDICTED: secreted frizzled-related protein 3-like [Acropora digitifera]